MPNFKPKTNRKIKFNKKTSITLDGKHKEFLNEFSKYEIDTIPNLKIEKQELKKKLENINNDLTLEQKLDIADKINEITLKINDLKNKKKEYFLDNSKFIFDYFENKKNISNGSNTISTNKNTLVNNFFKIKQEEDSSNILDSLRWTRVHQRETISTGGKK